MNPPLKDLLHRAETLLYTCPVGALNPAERRALGY